MTSSVLLCRVLDREAWKEDAIALTRSHFTRRARPDPVDWLHSMRLSCLYPILFKDSCEHNHELQEMLLQLTFDILLCSSPFDPQVGYIESRKLYYVSLMSVANSPFNL